VILFRGQIDILSFIRYLGVPINIILGLLFSVLLSKEKNYVNYKTHEKHKK
jgi:hypothetical protein